MIAYNGEINTLRGNINWMHARGDLPLLRAGGGLAKIMPVVVEGGATPPSSTMPRVPRDGRAAVAAGGA